MPLTIALTAANTVTSGPFPPNYPAGAHGFTAAASNPSGVSAGSINPATYLGAPIVAFANEKAASPTQLILVLQGTYDQSFIGTITYTDGVTTYAPTAAAFSVTQVNGVTLTQWIWALSNSTALITGNFTIGDTSDQLVALSATTQSSTEIDLSWVNSGPASGVSSVKLYRGVSGVTPTLYQTLGAGVTSYSDTGLAASTTYTYYVQYVYSNGLLTLSQTLNVTTPASGISATFNCGCEASPLPVDGFTSDTLANLRRRFLIRCGYASVASNPPPGMKLLANELLLDAQNQLFRQHYEKRTKRMYAWQMVPNIRYYGISQDESSCRTIDSLSVEWMGFEDLNQAWYPLICGIDPVLYTRAQISTGWPTHYEIRSCIEIFPAPRAPYTLWAKGRFVLDRFTQDTDATSVDAESVYLLACGMYKTSVGQPDGASLMTQAGNWTKYLVAGMHDTRRYVPRTRVQTPMTPPRFLPLEE